ncbi:RNase H domain-containing protein [Trichonephila clavipes]|uniref:RNase H domain-containing protein n=1 Tax=Trichonephila clavipes TaxID=2585209 RepID=A0A8X6VF99_TRICX|nr:RNase H domain-containing protein [Trichonephila clavipes]
MKSQLNRSLVNIQEFADNHKITFNASKSTVILFTTNRLGQRKQVRLLWIPSHVGGPENEAADELAGRGCDLPNPSSTVLTHTEIHSFQRNKMNLTWRNPPAHHWYAAKSPGLSIQCKSSRALQTAFSV